MVAVQLIVTSQELYKSASDVLSEILLYFFFQFEYSLNFDSQFHSVHLKKISEFVIKLLLGECKVIVIPYCLLK